MEAMESRLMMSIAPAPAGSLSYDDAAHVLWSPDTPVSIVEEWESQFAAIGGEVTDIDGSRWTSTATNGSGLTQGHPSTITWSVVPDGTAISGFNGEPAAPSNFRAMLTNIYGSSSVWLPVLQQVFDRWEAVSGIDFVYEASDDGVSIAGSNRGVLGQRGDIRLSGHTIDGTSNILAYNFFPNSGDMVLDTADGFYNNTSNNSRALRNVIAHEIGHGLGMDHVIPVTGTKLMEPYASTSFDGPQHDDILRINRGYGDRLEGNDTTGTAYSLGSLNSTATNLTDVSIDDDADVDYYTFTVGGDTFANITLAPHGFSYTVGLQNGATELYDSRALSDLSMTVLRSNGTTVVASANAFGLGGTESLTGVSLTAGQYYLRINGAQNTAQMYTLALSTVTAGELPPTLAAIGNQTITVASQNAVIQLSATDPEGGALTYSATAQSIEYHLDQSLGLGFSGGNESLNWGGRSEKWLTSTSGTWYYIVPDGKVYRWLGSGSLASDPLVDQVSAAAYSNTALLHSAAANNAPAVITVSGNTLTINPSDSFAGKFVVSAAVTDPTGRTDSEMFTVTVQSAAVTGDTTAPTITSRTPANGATVNSAVTNIDVAFSEAVAGVDITDLVLTGSGAASAVTSAPTNIGNNTWRFAVSNFVSGAVNVSLAPDANDIEDAAGNDLAPALWSFNVSISAAQQPPVLAPIGNQTINASTQNLTVQLSATDADSGDTLAYSASAQTLEYHLDQTLGLSSNGNYDLNWGGLQEKWMTGPNSQWYYIKPDGTLWRWAGSGPATNATLIDTVSAAAYANPALLHNAAANAAPATVTVNGNAVIINPSDTFTGRFVVTATVSDGQGGTDSETFIVSVLSTGPDTAAPTITARTPTNGSTVGSAVTNIDVTFSEAVTGVDVTDLALTGVGAASAVKSAPVNMGNNMWRFAVSNLADGPVGVALAPDANDIEDAAGNDLAPALWSFSVNIQPTPQAPVLATIGNQTMPTTQDAMTVQLSATDGNNDPLTFTVSGQSHAYVLDQSLGLSFNGNYDFNWGGRSEKWMTGSNNTWYYITPNGQVYRWLGSGNLANDPLVATVGAEHWTNPALLHNAAANNAPAALSISGNELNINPTTGFTGKLFVTVNVSDGNGGSDNETFEVNVTSGSAIAATSSVDTSHALAQTVARVSGWQRVRKVFGR